MNEINWIRLKKKENKQQQEKQQKNPLNTNAQEGEICRSSEGGRKHGRFWEGAEVVECIISWYWNITTQIEVQQIWCSTFLWYPELRLDKESG